MKKSVVGFFLIFNLFLLFGGAALQECKAGQATGTSPVYRFFNTQTGTHFFTISEAEKNNIIATLPHFTFEGVAWYCFPPNGGPPPDGTTQWGALNLAFCNDGSSLTFSVTIDGTTKTSTTHGLESTPSWAGYASTTAGSKSASWSLSGCTGQINVSGSGSGVLEAGKCYVFALAPNEAGTDVVLIYAEVPGCVDPRTLLSSSFEESSGAIDLEELGGITLQNGSDYLDFFDDKLEIIEEYELDSIE